MAITWKHHISLFYTNCLQGNTSGRQCHSGWLCMHNFLLPVKACTYFAHYTSGNRRLLQWGAFLQRIYLFRLTHKSSQGLTLPTIMLHFTHMCSVFLHLVVTRGTQQSGQNRTRITRAANQVKRPGELRTFVRDISWQHGQLSSIVGLRVRHNLPSTRGVFFESIGTATAGAKMVNAPTFAAELSPTRTASASGRGASTSPRGAGPATCSAPGSFLGCSIGRLRGSSVGKRVESSFFVVWITTPVSPGPLQRSRDRLTCCGFRERSLWP